MEPWTNFFLAQVGASATLAGLIFVSVSISLAKIVASPQLPARAFQALVVLLEILVLSSLMLVPQPLRPIGIEVTAIAAAVWIMVVLFDVRTLREAAAPYRLRSILRVVLSQAAALCFVAAGAAILGRGEIGFFLMVPAAILSYLVAILDAWVLLVEINR